jgi:hypothetical protein
MSLFVMTPSLKSAEVLVFTPIKKWLALPSLFMSVEDADAAKRSKLVIVWFEVVECTPGTATETAETGSVINNNVAAEMSHVALAMLVLALVEALEGERTGCSTPEVGPAKAIDKSEDNATGVRKAIMATSGTEIGTAELVKTTADVVAGIAGISRAHAHGIRCFTTIAIKSIVEMSNSWDAKTIEIGSKHGRDSDT